MTQAFSPTEIFKRATASTLRAIAERDDLTVGFGPEPPGLSGARVKLPNPARDLPPEEAAQPVRWDRPILYTAIAVKEAEGRERTLHVVNLHLRSTMAAFIPGQKVDAYTWISVPGWAEGFFLNILKRAGQALETRFLIDRLFDADESALVAVCGDFNAGARETPVRVLRAEEEDTGNGRREAGHAALDTFTEWKAVYVDFSGRLQRAQIDTE